MNSDGFAVSSKGITRPRRSILVAKEWNLLIWESICRCESTACINTRFTVKSLLRLSYSILRYQSILMGSKHQEILKRNFADLKRRLPIEDILCSEKLKEHFGSEEIRIIKCCSTMQEKSNEFLLKLLRKPQAAFDVFMSLLLEFSPPLHSQLEEGIARNHNIPIKPRLMENPVNGTDEAGVHQVPVHRGLRIEDIDTEIKEWLSGQLNGTKSDRSKVIKLGKALHMDDSTMGVCMRVSNPLGFLLNEFSNQNEDEANVDNLITAMNKCGLDDVSNHLLSLMNH